MRRGEAQFLAAAGVGVWRIQALARRLSVQCSGTPKNPRTNPLSISKEAASGRQQNTRVEDIENPKSPVKDIAGGPGPSSERYKVDAVSW